MANGASKAVVTGIPGPSAVKSPPKPKIVKAKAGPASPKKFTASMYSASAVLPDKFSAAVQEAENLLKMPLWMIIQDGAQPAMQPPPFHGIDESVRDGFYRARHSMAHGKPIALLIDSAGGQAKCAYQIATFLKQHCTGFVAIVPEYAKSAATLLSLGASEIILSNRAELGPLDVQVFDPDREQFSSALDEVQALERLNAFALQAVDQGVLFFHGRSGKSIGTLLPQVQGFVSDMLHPLFEKLNTVHYTQMSRSLKVAEEYAVRLLQPKYSKQEAEKISRHLVHNYPEHGFFIDRAEAASFGLKAMAPSSDLASALDRVVEGMRGVIAVGQLKEIAKP